MSNTQHPINRVLDALDERGLNPKRHATGWAARCPAHEDRSPSLSISETETGSVLVYCFAGCLTVDIINTLGLNFVDLFPPDPTKTPRPERDGRQVKAQYHYYSAEGEILYRVVKYTYPDGRKTFRQQAWRNGGFQQNLGDTERVLYNLPQIMRGIADRRTIWIVEGEKDAETLQWHGAIATCNPGGADNGTGNKFTTSMANSIEHADTIVICIDNDQPGQRHGRYLFQKLSRPNRRITIFQPTRGKDITDHLTAGGNLSELELLDDTDNPTGWADVTYELQDHEIELNENGWQFLNIAEIIASDYTPPRPEILQRNDGQPLLYSGRINSLFGESGSGKSWIALAATIAELNNNHQIIYIDLEDHISGIIERLRQLGATDEQLTNQFNYLSPWAAADEIDLEQLEHFISTTHTTLIVIDSVGEAMALGGTNPNADEEVARWYRTVPRRLANAGPAVLLTDHQPKNTDVGPLFAIGSQRKRAAIDGIAYRVIQKTPFARGESGGRIDIQVAKDRAGTFANKYVAASFHFDSTPNRLQITITPADQTATPSDQEQRLETISATMAELHTDGIDWLTLTDIKDALKKGATVRKHTETVKELVLELIEIGCVEQTNISKKNIVYRLVHEYTPDMVEWLETVGHTNDAPTGATAPDDPRQPSLARSGAARPAPHPFRGGAGAPTPDQDDQPKDQLIQNAKRFTH